MAPSVRRSILIEFLIVSWFVLPAPAQHRGFGPAPAPAPPISHAPAYHPPIYQPQVYRSPGYAPVYSPRVSSATSARPMNTLGFRPPPRPIRPFPPVIVVYPFPVFGGPSWWNVPFWPSTFCWWASCDQFWISSVLYNPAPLLAWNPASYALAPASEPPVYVFGQEGPEFPQLFLKDGSILNVTDYWVIDGQLHFMMMQEEGTKPSEQAIPFDELDLQKTVDVNTNRGFHFMLRNEPFERYILDHPEGTPPATPPQ